MATVDSKPAFNLRLRIPKCWLVWRLLRYTHAAGRACHGRKYRSNSLFADYFGIHTPPAGLAQAAFTEVLACLAATSVFLSSRHSIQDRDYRSNRVFALYFRNLIKPSTTPAASFTEVWQVFLSTSVISSTPTLLQLPHLRKYGKFFSPLP